MSERTVTVDPAIQAVRQEFRLRYVEPSGGNPGSGTGIQSLIDGQLAFAQSSPTKSGSVETPQLQFGDETRRERF